MLNEARLVQTFLELVQIDSPSTEEQAIAEAVAARLKKLGARVEIDPLLNVIATLAGKGVKRSTKPFFLNAHTDNVAPARGIHPIVANGRIASDGTTVLGADDLAGVTAILEGVESLVEEGVRWLPLEIVITSQEELGLVGAKGLDVRKLKAKQGVVLDSGGPVGAITLGAPTHNHLQVTITGKAAHSAAPTGGINALTLAANALSAAQVGVLDKETTANFGMIQGGSARNIVPDRVELMGEVRSRNERKLERATRRIKSAFEQAIKGSGAQLDFRVTRAYSTYQFSKNDALVKHVASALVQIGRAPTYRLGMGGSDANIWNAKGIKTVVASVGYEKIHTTDEYIPIEELVKAAELVRVLAAGE